MTSSVRVAIGAVCLSAGVVLCVASFTVRNEVIAWYSRSGLLLLIVGGVLLRQGLRRLDRPTPTETNDAPRRFLLVLLRRSSFGLNAQALEAAARSAWDDRFGRNHDGSDYVESGAEGIGFVVQAHGNAFLVLEMQKGERDLEAPRRAHPASAIRIWSEYSHDLSVGLVYNYDTDADRLCAFVGSLCAALADGETLALFHPDSGQLWRYDRDTRERLKTVPDAFFNGEQTE